MSFTPNPQLYPQDKKMARKCLFYQGHMILRVGRIELPPRPWQGRVLPLNDTRLRSITSYGGQAPPYVNILQEKSEKQNMRPGGLEPSITVPKTVVISVSLRAQTPHSYHNLKTAFVLYFRNETFFSNTR